MGNPKTVHQRDTRAPQEELRVCYPIHFLNPEAAAAAASPSSATSPPCTPPPLVRLVCKRDFHQLMCQDDEDEEGAQHH